MENPNKLLSKKKAIKTFLIIFIGSILISMLLSLIAYGKLIPAKPFLIALVIFLIILVFSSIIGYRYRKKMEFKYKEKTQKIVVKKVSYLYIIIGGLMVLINATLIFINEARTIYYINLLVGAVFFIVGIIQIKKNKN